MCKVVFRRAIASDLPAIVRLLADDGLGRGREDPSLPLDAGYITAFDVIDRDPNQLQAVADQGGLVVGCLQLTFIPGLSQKGLTRGLVESVRVASELRGQGIGVAFLTWAIAECQARGCGAMQLTSNASRLDAQRFYKRLGFVASHIGMKLVLPR